MNTIEKIPIQNIYYLLCYAWNKLEERDIVSVKVEGTTSLMDLFAKVLLNGCNILLRRGLDRGYVTWSDDARCLRGKISFTETVKRNLLANGKIQCEYDELSHNILHNQIIKSTIHQLIHVRDLSDDSRDALAGLQRKLHEIECVRLHYRLFSRVQLHQNNAFYDFLLKVCEIIYLNLLTSEEPGKSKFRDFLRDERQMAYLFEEFVRNFYRIESGGWLIRREEIPWRATSKDGVSISYLPKMITDVSMETEGSKIVIEVKFYKEAMETHFGQEKVHSTHLYQLYAYLKNLEAKGGVNKNCCGVLLYPTVDKDLKFEYDMDGHKVSVRTVNLNQNWKSIHDNMLQILDEAA